MDYQLGKHDNSKMAKCIAGERTIRKNIFLQVCHQKYCLEILDIHAVIFYTEAPRSIAGVYSSKFTCTSIETIESYSADSFIYLPSKFY